MGTRVFLCEKPSQAKDIGAVLGVLSGRQDGYFQKDQLVVTWALGHLLTQAMPDAYDEALKNFGNIDALPVIPQQWQLEVNPKVKKQFAVIKKLLSAADEVVIATDADREGEAIARELLEYCRFKGKVSRFWTSALDSGSVKKALANILPGSKTEKLYQASLARSRADWLIGMNLSRAYTVAYAAGYGKEHTLSIGRIQTPTLHLVVRRDLAIENFRSYPHYGLNVFCRVDNETGFKAHWQIPDALKNADGYCTDLAFVQRLSEQLHHADGLVSSVDRGRKRVAPPLPYSLSALQKEAGKKLGLSPSKVLNIAQTLYETYKITSYPRTPCRYLPTTQRGDVPSIFEALAHNDAALKPILAQADPGRDGAVWNDKEVAKLSHHGIIPTATQFDLSQMKSDELKIYRMIRDQYIAQFYPDYEYDATMVIVESCGQRFKAHADAPVVQGWRSLLRPVEEKDKTQEAEDASDCAKVLEQLNGGETVQMDTPALENKKTTPPPAFTEATLLGEMESLSDFLKEEKDEEIKRVLRATQGLGTEATRAAIIDRLLEMKYIEKIKGKVHATEKGRQLIARIPKAVADPATSAKWEIALSGIEAGKLGLADFLRYQEKWVTELVEQAKADAANKRKTS